MKQYYPFFSTVFIIFLLLSCSLLQAQKSATLNQTIKGTVLDKQAQYPLIGVNIVLIDSTQFIGATTDLDGNFELKKVPIGRQMLRLTYVGYEEVMIPNILVGSAKQVVLNIEMEEKVSELEEFVVSGQNEKHKAINEMASVSARTISIEEVARFSGSTQDPARMAQSYAGVSGASDDRNDIIVRGNAPTGVLWRLEGVDIPSPNHFAALGTTGGPVSMLNINNLQNSDFLSSAFPAEYGNATSAVFDLRLRNGNTDKYEFLGQMGFNGFEAGVEGPLKIGKNASFLANYRYSTLGIFQALGIQFGTGFAVPQYQDLTFKLNVPTEKLGKFSLWGLGGLSFIEFLAEEVGDDNLFSDDSENSYFASNTGVVGLSHTYFFNNNTFSKLTLSISGTQTAGKVDERQEDNEFERVFGQNYQQFKYAANWKLNKKINTKNRFTLGANYDLFAINAKDSVRRNNDVFVPDVDFNGQTSFVQAYGQWQHRFNDKLKLTAGIHGQYLSLNNATAIEPRLGLKYAINKKHTFSLGTGLHSQMQPVLIYFLEDDTQTFDSELPNKSLDFTKSTHAALAWDYLISSQLRLKVEAYHQYLYDVPVEDTPSSFSMLNTGADFGFPDKLNLKNNGEGANYGLELSLEKFFANNYYFLITGSVFQSKYMGSDEEWRNTLFNSNYVANFLAGKEFKFSERFSLTLDTKLTLAGGRRSTPVLLAESIAAGEEVLDEDNAFSERYANYFRPDFKIGFRQNTKRITQTFSVDLQNVSNNQNIFAKGYKASTQKIATTYQRGFFPDVRYQILF